MTATLLSPRTRRPGDRSWPAWLAMTLALAGCAGEARRPAPPTTSTATTAITGIPSCDAYLASYQACHQSAATFPAAELGTRYQAMRDSLLASAQDPRTRPVLAQRCVAMQQQMLAVLHGKRCG